MEKLRILYKSLKNLEKVGGGRRRRTGRFGKRRQKEKNEIYVIP